MKSCNKCNITKDLKEFSKNKRNKDGLDHFCKSCISVKTKASYEANKQKHSEKRKLYYRQNKEKENLYTKKYYELNKKEILEKNKKYVKNNQEKTQEYQREYHKTEKYLEYKSINSDKIKAYDKEYRQRPEVKERINKQISERNKKRKSNDPLYKLMVSIRSSISNNFKCGGFKKSKRTEEILGCSFEDFKIYLETKFESWMNWENKGLYNGEFNYGWDIDHIKPLNTACCEEDLIKLNHYTNLQPLCSKVNREIKRENYEVSI